MTTVSKFSAENQNSLENLERLSAQRYLYSSAKFWILIQHIAALVISIGGALAAHKIGPQVSLFSVVYLLADTFLIDRLFIKKRIKEAALIQKAFNCDVLDLSWTKVKYGSKVQPESVHRYARRMKGTFQTQKLINWYSVSAFTLPVHLGRVVCQRACVSWNLTGRSRVLLGLHVLILGYIIWIVILAFSGANPGMDVFIKFIVPTLPFARRLADIWLKTSDGNARLERLQGHSNGILETARLNRNLPNDLAIEARAFQSELYDFRSKEIPVFDSFYRFFRDEDETAMVETTDALVAEMAQDRSTK